MFDLPFIVEELAQAASAANFHPRKVGEARSRMSEKLGSLCKLAKQAIGAHGGLGAGTVSATLFQHT